MTNMQSGLISRTMGEAIIVACDEALAGKFDDSFITDGIQGGAGTTANMNVNEVIANRATAAGERGHRDGAVPVYRV